MNRQVAGVDLGKSSLSFVLAAIDPDGGLSVRKTGTREHQGKPHEAFIVIKNANDGIAVFLFHLKPGRDEITVSWRIFV